MTYLVVFLLLLILMVKYDLSKSNKKYENVWYVFVLVIFIAVAGLRYKVGGDTLNYMQYFNDIPFIWQLNKFGFSEAQFDPLWIIFSSISKSIINDFTFFQILFATVINVIIFRFIKQNTIYRFTTLLLYFLFFYIDFNMEILRQSLAICVFLLSYPYLKEHKWFKFYICAVVAFLFHSSAIILFVLPLLRNIKFKSLTVSLLIVLFFLITFIPDGFKNLLSILIFNDRLSFRFAAYADVRYNTNGMIVQFFIYFLLPATLVYFTNKKSIDKPVFHELYFAYFFLAIIAIGFTGFARFLSYLIPFMAIYFANSLNLIYRIPSFSHFKRVMVTATLFVAFYPKISYYFIDTSNIVRDTRRYSIYYPYNSVFFKQENPKREKLYDGIMNPD